MKYSFSARGHPNVLATHKTTLEVTKDSELTMNGNCIVAVEADFSLERVQEIIRSCHNERIKLTIEAAGIKEEIIAVANNGFCSDHEIVFRKGSFVSERTLGINSDKAARDLSRELVAKLKSPEAAVSVTVEPV